MIHTDTLSYRKAIVDRLSNTHYDVLIIGGGVTGAGIALDAALRGMKVCLVERKDFASGTSSKSTKLIHGGLRYLKQLDVKLVREVGQERAIVHRIAPHLVLPEKMLLPLIKGGSFGRWATSFGLFVYDWLADVKGEDKYDMLNKEETLAKEPLLDSDRTLGSGYYAEYRTDDARLTIELLKTAQKNGAMVLNYCPAKSMMYDNGTVSGAECYDSVGEINFTISAKVVINATGPWSDELRKQDGSLTEKKMYLTKGIHIVVPKTTLPVGQAVYFDVSDGRMIFAIPRQDTTYIGTTDTHYTGSLDDIRVDNADRQYLMDAVNHMFPAIDLSKDDIISSWAGVRPLIYEEGKSASEISRKDEIFVSKSNLVTIAGGKLTGYRMMAKRVLDLVNEQYFSNRFGKCSTEGVSLTGGPFDNYKSVLAYKEEIQNLLITKGLEAKLADSLVHIYGRQTDTILQKMPNGKMSKTELILQEYHFAKAHEWVVYPDDFWERRTGRSFFAPDEIFEIDDRG